MGTKLIYDSVTYEGNLSASGGNLNMTHAMVGETLAVDTLTVSVISASAPPVYQSGGAALYYNNGQLIGKYYLSEIHQVAANEYQMRFVSAISLLDRSKHYGGMYSNVAAGTVIADIMGDVDYSIEDDVAAVLITGYLPYATRRSNLQQVLMAIGGAVRNAADGSLRVTSLSDTVAGTFGTDRVFEGGRLIDKEPATAVQLTEHNFIASTEEVTLYDASVVGTETIIFTEPYHSLTITGGTIDESGANYCIISATGAVVLKGKKYTHVTRVITEGTAPTGSPDDVVKSVSENTLLNPNNATDVAERLYDYLSVAQSIQSEVLFRSERPGDVVSVIHPYTRSAVTACTKSMDIAIGANELRANSEFLIGYTPPSLIAGFSNYAVLDDTGTWEVPAGVTKIRAILVGGGDGGPGGASGLPGTSGDYSAGGAGGAAGDNAPGGSIFETNIAVTGGDFISYACGAGGEGGLAGQPGSAGGNTTFGSYSSAYGRKYSSGYPEPKSMLTIGLPGTKGVDGGKGNSYPVTGGDGPSIVYNETTYTPGANGDAYGDWRYKYNGTWYYAGMGGGAAAGNNGYPGEDWTQINKNAGGGNGGNAADIADVPDSYGQGGIGGNGGGGGGASFYPYAAFGYNGPGAGGTGGKGGNGKAGCVIIYF